MTHLGLIISKSGVVLSWNQPMYQLQNKKTTRKNIFNGLLKEIMFINRLNYRPTKNSSGGTFTLCSYLHNISKIYYKWKIIYIYREPICCRYFLILIICKEAVFDGEVARTWWSLMIETPVFFLKNEMFRGAEGALSVAGYRIFSLCLPLLVCDFQPHACRRTATFLGLMQKVHPLKLPS